jgi:hypothetical protein
MVSFRIDEDDFSRLDTFAQQTSCSPAEVFRRCLRTARLESTVDAQALIELSEVHADLNRIGGLLKLAIREAREVRALPPLDEECRSIEKRTPCPRREKPSVPNTCLKAGMLAFQHRKARYLQHVTA